MGLSQQKLQDLLSEMKNKLSRQWEYFQYYTKVSENTLR